MSRRRTNIAMIGRIIRFILPLLLLIISGSGSNIALAQDTGNFTIQDGWITFDEAVQESGVEGEPISTFVGEVIETVDMPFVPARPVRAEVFTSSTQQIPVIKVHGEYFDPSGLCSSGPLSEVTVQSVMTRMLRASDMGFKCFMLRVDWVSVAGNPNSIDTSKVKQILQYANDIGIKVIISLEFNFAPEWFFRGTNGSGRLMFSYLVDPEQEKATGNDGDLRWANGTGIPIPYHPDTIRGVSIFVVSMYNSLKNEQALIGWYLSGPTTMAFPGGGRRGVVGMCDYSPYTVNLFNEIAGTPVMAYPLERYSQGIWDQRADFRLFRNMRLQWKREAFDAIVSSLAKVDDKHIIFIGMDPVLNYRSDNGYLSMVQSPDSTRQMLNANVDGVIINFQLASNSFDRTNVRTRTSVTHLSLTINQVLRNGKAAIVMIEPDMQMSPSIYDINQIAYMIKASGAYPIWCSGFIEKLSHKWNWVEENAIERTQPLSFLPPPERLRRAQVAIFDFPPFYGAFYAESNNTLRLALSQLAMQQRSGVLMEVVGVDELTGARPVLQQYREVIYLAPSLLNNDQAKSWLDPAAQLSIAGYLYGDQGVSGRVRAEDPLILHQYALDNYYSPDLEARQRTYYIRCGAAADLLHGAEAFIIANDPYIFIRINSLHGSRYIDITLEGWPEANLDWIDVVDVTSGNLRQVEMISENASFQFNPVRNKACLYMLNDNYEPVGNSFEMRKMSVSIAQQTRHMKRCVPAALLFAAMLIVTMVWMTFQSQQRSLLQAAELVERRRRIEPIDILDQPEVMEFYKTYISDSESDKKQESPDEITRKYFGE